MVISINALRKGKNPHHCTLSRNLGLFYLMAYRLFLGHLKQKFDSFVNV